MINIIATMAFDQSEIQKAQEKLQRMLLPSRAEKGNIQYLLYQDQTEKGCFVFYEIWESLSVFEQHKESSHFCQLIEYVNEHAKHLEIKQLSSLDV
ncbi:putative quinol monooxygenase [Acinetobacter nectaris]|uniref:putative quinol monooxygenase n=1 Tax=Acinetobacter nectaris TaxID=1219382 RepID=UPI001F1C68A3|nr:putative quinol monooxygenase [Acinetobacter nectaris]MCF9046621.1 antibiotic biosynthesis monooxygenase [Acinetobacter nectaris]